MVGWAGWIGRLPYRNVKLSASNSLRRGRINGGSGSSSGIVSVGVYTGSLLPGMRADHVSHNATVDPAIATTDGISARITGRVNGLASQHSSSIGWEGLSLFLARVAI